MPVQISTYNYNYGTYDNFKANLISNKLARNRWGKKFATLYKKHSALEATSSTYNFTPGMRAVTGSLSTYNAQLEEYSELRELLKENLKVKDEEGIFSFSEALKSSFFTVTVKKRYVTGECYTNCITYDLVALSAVLSSQTKVEDGRLVSWVSNRRIGSSSSIAKLEALDEADALYGLRLYADDGLEYGHYSGRGIKSLSHNATLTAYAVDEKNSELFHVEQENLFTELWGEAPTFLNPIGNKLESYLFKMTLESESLNTTSLSVGDELTVMFGLGQVLDDLNDSIELLEESIENEENNDIRVHDDIELIQHLGMEEMLVEEIDRPHKIRNIWFKLEKKIENYRVINTSENSNYPQWVTDPDWEWWKEPEFEDTNENYKNFREHISLTVKTYADDGMGERVVGVYAKVKLSALDTAGYKIFWLIFTFLDVEVQAKKRSFLQTLFSVVMLIVAIYLTAVSGNPTWLKIILIATTVLSHFGVLSPKVQLAVAVLTLAYGAFNTNFSIMSSMQMFRFAVNNINMVVGMLELYENIKIEKDSSKEELQVHELQEQSMEYIYTDAYNQYDDLYSVFSNYDPQYKSLN